MNKKRLFVAIKPNFSKENLKFIREIKEFFSDEKFKWVENKNIHLTIKFIGETEEQMIPVIENALEKVIKKFQPFEFNIKGLGVFKNIATPRVFWMGIEKNEYLKKIFINIENVLESFGVRKENRDFNPHITIARIKNLKNKKRFLEFLSKNIDKNIQKIYVQEIILMESILKKDGPLYIEKKKFKL